MAVQRFRLGQVDRRWFALVIHSLNKGNQWTFHSFRTSTSDAVLSFVSRVRTDSPLPSGSGQSLEVLQATTVATLTTTPYTPLTSRRPCTASSRKTRFIHSFISHKLQTWSKRNGSGLCGMADGPPISDGFPFCKGNATHRSPSVGSGRNWELWSSGRVRKWVIRISCVRSAGGQRKETLIPRTNPHSGHSLIRPSGNNSN